MSGAGIIFWRALRDSRRGIIGWGALLGGTALLYISIFPQIEGLLETLGPFLENPLIRSLIGDVGQYTTLGGYMGMKFLTVAPVMLFVYAVVVALGIVAGEEERGTLDVLLSTPAPRWQIIVEKFAALTVALLLILALLLAGMVLGALLLPPGLVTFEALLEAALNILPVTLFVAALALLLSTVLRSRNTAGAVTGAIVAAAYFMTTLGDMAGGVVGDIKYLSFYQYYGGTSVMTSGIQWGGFFGLLAGAAILLGLSIYAFQRRDLR